MWRSRRRTKETRERGDGERSRRRSRVRFCASVLALPCFPRGVRWDEMWKPHCGRAPDCAKESSTLWTLFFGFAAKYLLPNFAITAILESPHPRPPHPGTRKDLPESNLCSGRSGCTAIISIRSNDQTRAALKRRGVGLHARSGVEERTALSNRWHRSWRERGPRDRSRRSPSRLCWASRNRQPSPTGRDNTSRTTRGRADSPS